MSKTLVGFLVLTLCLITSLTINKADAGREPDQRTEVILLGTGTPYPDPKASGPATAVVSGGQFLLFDAGAGVMRQINAAKLPISGPQALFITHLHTDHTFGYAELVLTSWIMRRRVPIKIYGPPGLRKMSEKLLAAYAEDIRIRTEGLEREIPGAYKVDVQEIRPGVAYDVNGVRVTAFPVQHGSWKNAYGYRVDAADRSIVISGDARPSESLVSASHGVDVLVHEVYAGARLATEDRPGGEFWPQYMREFHTSDLELGELAQRINPKLLIMTHIIRMGASDEELVANIRKGGFSGNVAVGKDLDRY
ncbi:MAG TPA: MBL fold metallo-hydrolase [Pyrinomonadaceae bacterium]|jgi:ribonuclease Z|nr:MBL fold metallo-hydrolase [Pyrinomonadaceae bacterium]